MRIKRVGQFLIWGESEITKVICIISRANREEYPGVFKGYNLAVCVTKEGGLFFASIISSCSEVKGEATKSFPGYAMPQPGDRILCRSIKEGKYVWAEKTFKAFTQYNGSSFYLIEEDDRFHDFPIAIKLLVQ